MKEAHPFENKAGIEQQCSHDNSAKNEQSKQAYVHRVLKRKLFPKNLPTCFECDAKLTSANRKRMAMIRRVSPTMINMAGYQLCKACADKMDRKQLHKLPRIAKDLREADFLEFGFTVGGVQ